MSLEQECRRKPDIEGIPVRLRNGEDWLIPQATVAPVFEREDGQWMFKRLGMGEPFKSRFDRINELWRMAAENNSLPEEKLEELVCTGLEIAAMALDQNYELTAKQLGELIDPNDQKMSVAILYALRGIDKSNKSDEGESLTVDEKKKKLNGSTRV